ncbi:MAG: hypothetical protein EDR02_18555, partial [Actinobacteria bacterium]
ETIEMGARQYVPALGRFIEVDPVEQGSANDYDYTSGSPTVGVDLDGTRKCSRAELLDAKRMAGISYRQSGWSCNAYTSPWYRLSGSRSREICTWFVPVYSCAKRMYIQERWQDFALTRRGRHVVVSIRQQRYRMRYCLRLVVTGYSQCRRFWHGPYSTSVDVYRE